MTICLFTMNNGNTTFVLYTIYVAFVVYFAPSKICRKKTLFFSELKAFKNNLLKRSIYFRPIRQSVFTSPGQKYHHCALIYKRFHY